MKTNTLLLFFLFLTITSTIAQEIDSLSHLTWEELDSLHLDLTQKGSYQEALLVTEKMIIRAKKIEGEISKTFAISTIKQANLNRIVGDYRNCESDFENSIILLEEVIGKNNKEYAWAKNEFGLYYLVIGKFQKAENLLLEAIEIYKPIVGIENTEYAQSLNNLAGVYLSTAKYELASDYLKQAIPVWENSFGKKDLNYTMSIGNLAHCYLELGKYLDAEALFLEAKSINKEIVGDNHFQYLVCLDGLGSLYWQLGKYEKVEPLFLEVAEKYKSIFGETHLHYINILNNLAVLYNTIDKYDQAEYYFLKVKGIALKSLGKNNKTYSTVLTNLAHLYEDLGLFEKAITFQIEAKMIDEEIFGKEHHSYAQDLNNLGTLHEKINQFEKAESFYLEAAEIKKKVFGRNHREYALTINNLAGLYRQKKEFEKAISNLNEAIEIRRNIFGDNHPDYAESLNSLGLIYSESGEFEKAEIFFTDALNINKGIFGIHHSTYADGLFNIGFLFFKKGDYNLAETFFLEANQVLKFQMENVYPILSESEKILFVKSYRQRIDVFNSFAYNRVRNNPKIATEVQNLNLAYKSLILERSIEARAKISSSKDSLLIEKYFDWVSLKRSIAKIYTSTKSKQQESNLDSLLTLSNTLEKDLSRKTHDLILLQTGTKNNILVNDLMDELTANEATIDFINFQYFNGKIHTNSIIYVAIITRSELEYPLYIPLTTNKEIEAQTHSPISVYSKSNYVTDLKKSHMLYQLLWEPLEPHLKEIKTIHLSSSGLLHTISFQSLKADTGHDVLLVDKYNIRNYSTLRDFILKTENDLDLKEILLFGGAQFDTDSIRLVEIAKQLNGSEEIDQDNNQAETESLLAYSRSTIPEDSTRSYVSFNYLPGTKNEVENISYLYQKKGKNSKKYLGETALEEYVKANSGELAPEILHIATHGYFFEPFDKESPHSDNTLKQRIKYAENPLLRSGLVFTGVNHTWRGGQPIAGMDDGVLTAYEISNLDLFNTKLAVLSACDTGLGDIHNGEGVFGLQRAFKSAGVDNLIISLWKVPDKETGELMQYFYKYLLKGKSIRAAFQKAQKKMRKKYPPYYWAAFILVE